MHQHKGEGYFFDAYRSYSGQNPPRKLDHYISMMSRFASVERPVVLDIGCGLGSFLHRASEQRPTWKLYGTDIRAEAIDCSREVLGSGVQLEIAAATQRPYPETNFDMVTAWDVLEHVEEVEAALALIDEMLTSNGRLFFVVPVFDGVTGPAIRWLDKDPTHVHRLGRGDWLELVSKRFDVLEWHGIFRYLLPGDRYLHLTTSRLRHFTPAILVVAKRTTAPSK